MKDETVTYIPKYTITLSEFDIDCICAADHTKDLEPILNKIIDQASRSGFKRRVYRQTDD